jgi:hypothetical protein
MPLNLRRREPLLSTITYNLSLLILTGGYIPTLATFLLCKGQCPQVGNEEQNERMKKGQKKDQNERSKRTIKKSDCALLHT